MSEIGKTQKQEEVSQYYGETLAHSGDLKTNACCTIQAYSAPTNATDRVAGASCGC